MSVLPGVDKKPVLAYLRNLIAPIDKAMEASVTQIAKVVQYQAQHTKLFKIGKLEKLIIINKLTKFGSEVVANAPYAYYLEEGNNQEGALIYPKNSKALHFTVNGQEVFAKYVKSHGPLPFMRQARDFAETKVPQIVSDNLKQAIKGVR